MAYSCLPKQSRITTLADITFTVFIHCHPFPSPYSTIPLPVSIHFTPLPSPHTSPFTPCSSHVHSPLYSLSPSCHHSFFPPFLSSHLSCHPLPSRLTLFPSTHLLLFLPSTHSPSPVLAPLSLPSSLHPHCHTPPHLSVSHPPTSPRSLPLLHCTHLPHPLKMQVCSHGA